MTQQNQALKLVAPWRIGVDVGGTFTDLVLRDAGGNLAVVKVPSVPENPSQGVLDALTQLAADLTVEVTDLLRDCALFVHGSTIATNTILEKKGAKVGLLTTQGFRDSLEVRRGIREDQWDHRAPFPEVLVPRFLRLSVAGRLDRDGVELHPLSSEDAAAAGRAFADEGVESVAICFLHAYRDGRHEQAAAEAIAATWSGDWLSQSHVIAPVAGEYERSSTTVINAYIAPKVVAYLHDLDDRLKALGLARAILLVQSNGGAISVDQVAARPVNLVLSGPAAGVGALNLYRKDAGTDDLISMEIGGTSCDVMLMSGGKVAVSDELIIDGYHLVTPSVEIHTVGAGGGTIARVDDAGMLRVGPQGAGAVPGPACYGRGGRLATVTDANMVLGRLRPGPYAGGSVVLDKALAERALRENVAEPLSLAVEEAAQGVLRLLEQNILHAVEHMSIQRGHDPRRFTLVAAGGAGPMHGASVARLLGCSRVYIPRQAGAFCALGMLQSDVRQDYLQVFLGDLDGVDEADMAAGFAALEGRADAALLADGFTGEHARLSRELDLRYRGQLWPIRVVAGPGILDRRAARAAFEVEHQRQFGHIQPDGRIEITALRVVGLGLIDAIAAPPRKSRGETPVAIDRRRVYVDARHGWQETATYRGADLSPGQQIEGPALIEEFTTTILAGPGDKLHVDEGDNIVIDIAGAEGVL